MFGGNWITPLGGKKSTRLKIQQLPKMQMELDFRKQKPIYTWHNSIFFLRVHFLPRVNYIHSRSKKGRCCCCCCCCCFFLFFWVCTSFWVICCKKAINNFWISWISMNFCFTWPPELRTFPEFRDFWLLQMWLQCQRVFMDFWIVIPRF